MSFPTRSRPVAPSARAASVVSLLAVLVVTSVAACTPVGEAPPPPEPEPAPFPSLEPGEATAEEEETAARLLEEAEAALEAGVPEDALQAARRVTDDHPTASGSAQALWLLARAALELDDPEEADAAAEAFAGFLDDDDPRLGEVRLLQGRARLEEGRVEDAVEVLLGIPSEAPGEARSEGLEIVRAQAARLSDEELERLLRDAVPGPASLVLRTETAVRHHFRGDADRAEEVADEVLEGNPDDPEERLARAIVEGRADEEIGAAALVLGALLPETGSPALQSFAAEIRDGLDVALAQAAPEGREALQLVVRDDEGSGSVGTDRLQELENEGVLALIGPLQEGALEEVARSRTSGTPLLSPTARLVPEDLVGEGVYSLGSVDPGGPTALARYARDEGKGTAVILRPDDPEAELEARFFTEAFEEAGGRVRDELVFEPSQSNFPDEMRRILNLQPDLLFLPLAPGEIQLVAPQIAFHGVDELDLLILGTDAWAMDDVLRSVPTRHTDGVIVSARAPAGEDPPGYEAFVEAYENHFRRTFRSPAAVVGWDAVQILLHAVEQGVRGPEEVRRNLERIEDFPGASGILSIRDGRIVRAYEIARIENGQVRPLHRVDDELGQRP